MIKQLVVLLAVCTMVSCTPKKQEQTTTSSEVRESSSYDEHSHDSLPSHAEIKSGKGTSSSTSTSGVGTSENGLSTDVRSATRDSTSK